VDPVSLAFLALIALVGGGIAYFADWLGRKLGKKRLRLGKLRPKHTAALGVVTSGIIISAFTIGLVYALSSDVRQWIQEGRKAIAEVRAARDQRDAADRESRKLLDSNSRLKIDLGDRQKRIEVADRRMKSLQKGTRDLQLKIDAGERAVHGLEAKLTSTETEYKSSKANLADMQTQSQALHKAYGGLRKTFDDLRSSYSQLQTQAKDISDNNYRLTSENLHLTADNGDLQSKGAELERKNKEAEQMLEEQHQEMSRLTEQMTSMSTQIRLAREELDGLMTLQAKLNNSVERSRERPLTFAVHEELARVSIAGKQSPEEVRAAITSLVRMARTTAEARGAKGASKDLPAAAIFKHEDKKTHQEYQPDEIVDRLSKSIAGKPEEQVLVATSTYNSFEGEPVSIEIASFPNPLVYRGGQVVAETRINGQEDEATVFRKIKEFLDGKVRSRAKTDHLIPVDNDTFGLIEPGQIIKVVKNVQTADRIIRLQAVARNDTRAGDSLALDFRIR
jgi:uncharacterized protein (DUF3084 family)